MTAVKKSKSIKVKNSMLKKKKNRTKKRITQKQTKKKKKSIRPRQVGGVGGALNTLNSDTLITSLGFLNNKAFLNYCTTDKDFCEKNTVLKKRLSKIRKSVMTDATIHSCVFNWIMDRGGADMSGHHTVEEGFRQSVLPIGDWNVSAVTNMNLLFNPAVLATINNKKNDPASLKKISSFNEDLSKWDVTNVTNMEGMFAGATSFNKNLLEWKDKVGNVTNMAYMFAGAKSFNHNLLEWKDNVGNVTDMKYMFFEAIKFNQDLRTWKVSEETNTEYMFLSSGIPMDDWSNYAPTRLAASPECILS